MALALLAARIGLAAVLATAGLAKLADREGSRRAVAGFGMPERVARPAGLLLPLAELLAAAALLPDRSARSGAAGALALLLVFSAAVALSLLRGRAPECRCFGQVHSSRVTWRTVARNLGLAAPAVALLEAGAGQSLSAPGVALAAVAILALAALLVLRARGRAGDPAGLAVGVRAPDLRLPALGGGDVTLADLLGRGRPVLLVFSDAHCGPCAELAPAVARWQREHGRTVTIAVIERGREGAVAERDEHGRDDVLRDTGEAARAYGADVTPSAVLVAASGRIASRLAAGAIAVEHAATGRRLPPATARPGGGMTRLELLARAGAAAAGIVLVGTRDALAGAIPIEIRCKYVRCGNRCCPKKAGCRTRGGKKVCVCPDGREACGAKCCPETFVCRKNARGKRICACPPRKRPCRGRCVPVTDPAHCGACGRQCPPATTCVNGQCVGGDGTGTGPGGTLPCECPPGQTCCEGACTDLNADEARCGRCDRACAPGETCCDGECRDLRRDPDGCGQCGKRCASGQVCADGRCAGGCPPGQNRCGRRCCKAGETCKDGACVADGGCGATCDDTPQGGFDVICCGGDCVPSRTDPGNCGGCGRKCVSPTPSLSSCGCSRGECYTVSYAGGEPCVASRPLTALERARRR